MDAELLISEITLKAIRSSGSGGQNVNKVSTKIELQFDVDASNGFDDEEKTLLIENLKTRLTKNNVLILQCDESRSQLKNKQIVKERFLEIIKEALTVQKERIPTKTPKAVKRKRLRNKRQNSEKKANRKPPELD
ncbi:MAG: aminoacyl-tRNA hydrolase [Flavobacteriaceae bacterium]|nr:aminoacyl-tRNA hydrolase [Flavobacteriaceae bacterium]